MLVALFSLEPITSPIARGFFFLFLFFFLLFFSQTNELPLSQPDWQKTFTVFMLTALPLFGY